MHRDANIFHDLTVKVKSSPTETIKLCLTEKDFIPRSILKFELLEII